MSSTLALVLVGGGGWLVGVGSAIALVRAAGRADQIADRHDAARTHALEKRMRAGRWMV